MHPLDYLACPFDFTKPNRALCPDYEIQECISPLSDSRVTKQQYYPSSVHFGNCVPEPVNFLQNIKNLEIKNDSKQFN